MHLSLRQTQTRVNHSFACYALEALCAPCKPMHMKVMLAAIRERQGMILDDIAEDLSVAVSTVQRWETQSMSIPSARLPAIARAYRCRINDIFQEGPDPEKKNDPEIDKVVTALGKVPSENRGLAINVTLGALERFHERKTG